MLKVKSHNFYRDADELPQFETLRYYLMELYDNKELSVCFYCARSKRRRCDEARRQYVNKQRNWKKHRKTQWKE